MDITLQGRTVNPARERCLIFEQRGKTLSVIVFFLRPKGAVRKYDTCNTTLANVLLGYWTSGGLATGGGK